MSTCTGCGTCCADNLTNCTACGITLSQFPLASTVNLGDEVVLANDKKITVENLLTALNMDGTTLDPSALPDGTIPKVVGGVLVASALSEDTDSVNSTLDIEIPNNSLNFPGNASLSHNGEVLANKIAGGAKPLITYEADFESSSLPTWVDWQTAATVTLQGLTSNQSTLVSFTIDISSLVAASAAAAFNFGINSVGTASGVRMSISKGGIPTSSNIVWQNVSDDQFNDGVGFSLVEGVNSLECGCVLDVGNTYYLRLDVPLASGDTITLRGNPSSEPYLSTFISQSPVYNLVTEQAIGVAQTLTYLPSDAEIVSGCYCDITGGTTFTFPSLTVFDQSNVLAGYVSNSTGSTININTVGSGIIHTPTGNVTTIELRDGEGLQWVQDASERVGFVAGYQDSAKAIDGEVILNSTDDAPAAVAGVRTFADGITYVYATALDWGTDELVMGVGTGLVGLNRFTSSMTSATTGNFITASSTFKLEETFFSVPNGTLFNLTGSGAQETLVASNCFASCKNIGNFDQWNNTVLRSFSFVSVTGTGLTFTGAGSAFNMDNSLWQGFTTGNTMIDFGSATFDRIQIPTGNRFNADTGVTVLSGLAASGNLTATGDGIVSHNIFEGVGTYLNNITTNDVKYSFSGNSGVADSMNDGHITMITNATNTVIAAVNTPTLILGTWTEESASRFTTTAAGRLTFDGLDDITVPVQFNCSIDPVSGSNKDLSIYIAKNGTVLTNSKSSNRTSAGTPVNIGTFSQVTFSTGEYVEFFVENNSDGIDILVDNAKAIVN